MRVLVYGYKGWIGSYFCEKIEQHYPEDELIYPKNERVEDYTVVREEIAAIKPDRVLCFIGRTSGPGCNTIDYLEDKLSINVRDNLYAPLILMKVCSDLKIHLMYMGTGCIFHYSEDETGPDTTPLSVDAEPNFDGSQYSLIKGYTDRISRMYSDSVLNVRIRMPITEWDEPKNFISKIASYSKIESKINSMTYLPELWQYLYEDVRRGRTGTVNLVNSTAATHEQILSLYKQYVKADHDYELVTDSSVLGLKSKRSNNILQSSYPDSLPLLDCISTLFKNGFNKR